MKEILDVKITASGEDLKDEFLYVPEVIANCVKLEASEAVTLYQFLYKLLNQLN